MKEEGIGRKHGEEPIFHNGSKGAGNKLGLLKGKGPCGSEDKCINPRSHSYTLHTGHKTVGMEHKT